MNAQLRPAEPRIGIFTDEPAETYYVRRLDEASNSGLKVIDQKSPAHYLHWINNPQDDEETPAMAFGSAYHMATLEPDRFDQTYVVLPKDAPAYPQERQWNAKNPSIDSVRAMDWWRSWEASNASRKRLSTPDYDKVRRMAESMRSQELIFPAHGLAIQVAELIDLCETEVTVRYADEETGILCKIRADLWSRELAFAADLKSTMDATMAEFAWSIRKYRYHVAHVHYNEAFRMVGEPLASNVLLPTEKVAPFISAAYHLTSEDEEIGWAIRQRSMRKLKACLDSGKWPGPTTTVTPIRLPPGAFYDAQED